MQTLLFIISGFGLLGLSTLIYAAFTAPEGIEDDGGFHLLCSTGPERDAYSPRLTLSEGEVIFFR
jgi:hypothetical protein